jgi:VanZ family protein
MWAVLLSGLYGVTDEFHQAFVPGRGAAALDVGIDTLGAALGVWLALRRRPPPAA